MIIDEEYFEHSGVKGMKWGVRRKQKKLAKIEMLKKKEIITNKTYQQVLKEQQKKGLTRQEAYDLFTKKMNDQGFYTVDPTKSYTVALGKQFIARSVKKV